MEEMMLRGAWGFVTRWHAERAALVRSNDTKRTTRTVFDGEW